MPMGIFIINISLSITQHRVALVKWYLNSQFIVQTHYVLFQFLKVSQTFTQNLFIRVITVRQPLIALLKSRCYCYF